MCSEKSHAAPANPREKMKETEAKTLKQDKLIFKVCHACGHCNESQIEPERCQKCQKAFLPLNYFEKIHAQGDKSEKFHDLFESSDALDEKDLIKGLYVLW
jgi:hypothetical protein